MKNSKIHKFKHAVVFFHLAYLLSTAHITSLCKALSFWAGTIVRKLKVMIQSLLVHALFIHKKRELTVMQRMLIYKWEKKKEVQVPCALNNGIVSTHENKRGKLTQWVKMEANKSSHASVAAPNCPSSLFIPSSSATSVKTWTLRYSPQPKKNFFLYIRNIQPWKFVYMTEYLHQLSYFFYLFLAIDNTRQTTQKFDQNRWQWTADGAPVNHKW